MEAYGEVILINKYGGKLPLPASQFKEEVKL
jgi:hypothetical protein